VCPICPRGILIHSQYPDSTKLKEVRELAFLKLKEK
jgi:hypothetical protein